MSKKKKAKDSIKQEAEKIENQEEKQLTVEEFLAIEKDKNLRLIAEFDNFRKRNAKERIELFATAGQDIMTILLPILDDLERAIEANEYD
ncbi:MAG TPA: nucleotide exchange factor GrpE, partial [Flavobacteriales bacterium]|nr:nucleotide exchange factor GrpE [Flavobacteriales bacterium]